MGCKNIKKEWLKKTLFFFIAALLFSCSFDKPEIPELSVKILKIETDAGTIEERLSLFLMYKDENGRNDYSSIQLVHLESGLTWVLNRENTSFFSSSQLRASDSEKTLWAGSNKIASPFGQIPIGEYSIVLEDLSGNRAIKKITQGKITSPSTTPRDGKTIDEVGIYHPIEAEERQIAFDPDKVRSWLDKGAQPTDTVRRLLNKKQFTL